jgi:hypothetical protein
MATPINVGPVTVKVIPKIDGLREVLLDMLTDPEFERELALRRMFIKNGPPLTRAEDYDLTTPAWRARTVNHSPQSPRSNT